MSHWVLTVLHVFMNGRDKNHMIWSTPLAAKTMEEQQTVIYHLQKSRLICNLMHRKHSIYFEEHIFYGSHAGCLAWMRRKQEAIFLQFLCNNTSDRHTGTSDQVLLHTTSRFQMSKPSLVNHSQVGNFTKSMPIPFQHINKALRKTAHTLLQDV